MSGQGNGSRRYPYDDDYYELEKREYEAYQRMSPEDKAKWDRDTVILTIIVIVIAIGTVCLFSGAPALIF